MKGFKTPIQICSRFSEENMIDDVKKSIDSFIDLLVVTPIGSLKSDVSFGFIFQNSRFENSDHNQEINAKKIDGDTRNAGNTYAHDLKANIERYEPRLSAVSVKMIYNPKQKEVILEIIGKYTANMDKEYQKNIRFFIW